jgi:hypothetical protein
MMRLRIIGTATAETAQADLAQRLLEKEFEQGRNGWHTAFLRGTLIDERVPGYLADAVNALPEP